MFIPIIRTYFPPDSFNELETDTWYKFIINSGYKKDIFFFDILIVILFIHRTGQGNNAQTENPHNEDSQRYKPFRVRILKN